MSRDRLAFPPGFLWGAATSAFQIEGSPLADGAGPSNWHLFAHTPGRIHGGDTGDLACDHYRRVDEDVALMGELGLQAYRFSIAWGRVQPTGRGRVNGPGLDFYERLVDRLLAAGIRPYPTLHHWDLPAALDEKGGWSNRDSAEWFADYAELVFRRLGDRVADWVTLNEPWVMVDGGYVHGVHPPGRSDLAGAPHAAHNLLRAHGGAVRRYRDLERRWRADDRGRIGLVVNIEPKVPASSAAADLAAARRADAYMNRQFIEPVFRGCYPAELAEVYGRHWPEFPAGDFALIGEPIDFLGLNYYTRAVTRHEPAAPPAGAATVRQPGAAYTALDWEVHPDSLRETLVWLQERCGDLPIYITENGAAFDDPAPTDDGAGGPRLADRNRVDYYRAHLRAVAEAVALGVDVRGYFAWSLLDNFEWAWGYAKRFGIVHVDFATQRRTIKDSGRFYRRVIETGGRAALDEGEG